MSSLELTLTRSKPGPWGFRLQGGVDFEKALTVVFVNPDSFSYNSGLRTGDIITGIGSLEATLLTHKEAQEAVISQGNSVQMRIQRNSEPEELAPGTWKPQVQIVGGPATAPTNPGQLYTKTSLTMDEKPQEEHWDVKHNITARGFQSNGPVPPPPTSADFRPVGAPGGGAAAPPNGSSGPSGFRSVSAPAPKAPSALPQQSGPPRPQVCWICGKPVTGVFLQVKGRPTHAECFACATCGVPLKNVGHFVIGDKLYCQTHAREAQQMLQGIAENGVAAQGQPGGRPGGELPQGLAQNLARLSVKPQGTNGQVGGGLPAPPTGGPRAPPLVGGPPAPPPTAAPSAAPPPAWTNRLNADSAGMASNAEDFTKEFMKQLAGN